jgi:cyclopropane fatty-acyl-phospholipid synthase-like methyltransferase
MPTPSLRWRAHCASANGYRYFNPPYKIFPARNMNNDFWNSRYAEAGFAYGTEPNAFLVTQKNLLKPGMKALAVADGEGRNGVWLAQQGLDVLSVDASDVGQRKTRELAADRGVTIHTEQADLTRWAWPESRFDLVVSIYVHFPPEVRARMHRAMFNALKPGGLLILEAFTPKQLQYKSGGPPVLEMLYTADMLRIDFAGAEIRQAEECVTDLEEGKYHRGPGAVVRLVLRRPGAG